MSAFDIGPKNVPFGVIWMVDNQLGRRNLQAYSRGKLVLRQKEAIAAKNAKNLRPNLPEPGQQGFQSSNSVSQSEPTATQPTQDRNATRREMATKAQVGSTAMYQIEYIEAHADEETKNKLWAGETTAHQSPPEVHQDRLYTLRGLLVRG